MRKILISAAVAMCFAASSAVAQERVGSAALGALSGAVVLGPVGAVAGAAIGYTAGPAIARSWGLGGSARRSRHAHAPRRSTSADARGRVQQSAPAKKVVSAPSAGRNASDVTGSIPTPSAKPPIRSANALPPPPAVQGFE
jgi:hypothetical protein